MLVVNTIQFFCIISMKIEFSSLRRETLLFLTTNMAAVTSRANQQLTLKMHLLLVKATIAGVR